MAHRLAVVATNAGRPARQGGHRAERLDRVQAGDPSALAAAVSGALGPDVDLRGAGRARPDRGRAGVLVGGGGARDGPSLMRSCSAACAIDTGLLGQTLPRNGRPPASMRAEPGASLPSAVLRARRALQPCMHPTAASVARVGGHRDGARACGRGAPDSRCCLARWYRRPRPCSPSYAARSTPPPWCGATLAWCSLCWQRWIARYNR